MVQLILESLQRVTVDFLVVVLARGLVAVAVAIFTIRSIADRLQPGDRWAYCADMAIVLCSANT